MQRRAARLRIRVAGKNLCIIAAKSFLKTLTSFPTTLHFKHKNHSTVLLSALGFAGIRRAVRRRPDGSIQAIGPSDYWVDHSKRRFATEWNDRVPGKGFPGTRGNTCRLRLSNTFKSTRQHELTTDTESSPHVDLVVETLRSSVGADGIAFIRRQPGVFDGPNCAGECDIVLGGDVARADRNPVVETTISGAHRQRVGSIERDTG